MPSEASLLAGAVAEGARSPLRIASALTSSARGLVARAGRPAAARRVRPFSAPRTSFTGAITARRSVAFARTSLADVRAVGRAAGATVNDVLLAATTSSLRAYLAAREGVPEGPLVAPSPESEAPGMQDSSRPPPSPKNPSRAQAPHQPLRAVPIPRTQPRRSGV